MTTQVEPCLVEGCDIDGNHAHHNLRTRRSDGLPFKEPVDLSDEEKEQMYQIYRRLRKQGMDQADAKNATVRAHELRSIRARYVESWERAGRTAPDPDELMRQAVQRHSVPRYEAEEMQEADVEIEGTYDAALEGVVKSIMETVLKRHRAYGHNLLRHGERGILIRVDDKTERISNLLDRGVSTSGGETISETWIDIAGYAIQAIMMRTGTFTLPMREAPHGGEAT